MSDSAELPELDRFYQLLPAIIRRRDAQEGRPLRALLRIITAEANFLEEDIGRLYDNWFIETCDDWVVPYLAKLVAWPIVGGAENPGAGGRLRPQRREVAKAISYRRRGGTVRLLEELAWDVTGWPAKAVEGDRLLATTADVRSPKVAAMSRFLELRKPGGLQAIGGPFDTTPHSAGVRSHVARAAGQYLPESLALYVWRTAIRRITRSTPKPFKQAVGKPGWAFTFDPLGRHVPLYVRPEYQPGKMAGSGIHPDIGFPVPIDRHHFDELLSGQTAAAGASLDIYGEDRSFAIYVKSDTFPFPMTLVPPEKVIYMNLRSTPGRLADDCIGVDPIRGLLIVPGEDSPDVQVTWHHAAPVGIGAGRSAHVGLLHQSRNPPPEPAPVTYKVSASGDLSLTRAIQQWIDDAPSSAVIEIADSGCYELGQTVELTKTRETQASREETEVEKAKDRDKTRAIPLKAQQRLEIRAARECVPLIRCPQGSMTAIRIIAEGAGSELLLDGLLVSGSIVVSREHAGTRVDNAGRITLRGCTVVPVGANVDGDKPAWRGLLISPGLESVSLENCFTGRIDVCDEDPFPAAAAEHLYDPVELNIADTVIHHMPVASAGDFRPDNIGYAIGGDGDRSCRLDIRRCTLFGVASVLLLKLAENTIFTERLTVTHRQDGGMRYCYVPPESETPRRYACQPDLAAGAASTGGRDAARASARPRFISTRTGFPGFAMLAGDCSPAITAGADDNGEIGALHDAFDFGRLNALSARMAEFVPARVASRLVMLSPGNEHELRTRSS